VKIGGIWFQVLRFPDLVVAARSAARTRSSHILHASSDLASGRAAPNIIADAAQQPV